MSKTQDSPGEKPPITPITKKILIVMPFERDAVTLNQLYRLIYRRLKYIICSKIDYSSANDRETGDVTYVKQGERPCQFRVSVILAREQTPIKGILDKIRESDIAIGFICAQNVSVVYSILIYELSLAHLPRCGLVLAVDGDKDLLRPQFVRDLGQILPTPKWIESDELIKLAAKADSDLLEDFDADPTPPQLKSLSDEEDARVEEKLRTAFQSVMDPAQQQTYEIRKLMEDLDPELMVSKASSYYPTVVVKFTWLPRSQAATGRLARRYTPNDLDPSCPPVVCDWNPKYLELFDLVNWNREDGPLPNRDQEEFLEKFMDPEDYKAYQDDQAKLMDRIVFGPQAGVAKVPIRFNSQHPNDDYQNTAFLPCCVLKKPMGNHSMTHYLYMLIVFLEVTESSDLIKNPRLLGTPIGPKSMPVEPETAESPGPAPAASGEKAPPP